MLKTYDTNTQAYTNQVNNKYYDTNAQIWAQIPCAKAYKKSAWEIVSASPFSIIENGSLNDGWSAVLTFTIVSGEIEGDLLEHSSLAEYYHSPIYDPGVYLISYTAMYNKSQIIDVVGLSTMTINCYCSLTCDDDLGIYFCIYPDNGETIKKNIGVGDNALSFDISEYTSVSFGFSVRAKSDNDQASPIDNMINISISDISFSI